MPTALWISQVSVIDPAAHGEYAKRAVAAIEEFGGEFLVRGGASVQLEGAERQRHIVVRFPSLKAAQDCYDSATYQEALSFAKGASERDLCIVEEVES